MILNLYLLYLYNMYNIRYHISIYIVYCGRLGKMQRGPRVQRERAMPSLCGDGAPSAQGRTPPQLMEKLENASKIEGIFRDLQGFSTMFLPFFGSRCGWCGFSVCFLRNQCFAAVGLGLMLGDVQHVVLSVDYPCSSNLLG